MFNKIVLYISKLIFSKFSKDSIWSAFMNMFQNLFKIPFTLSLLICPKSYHPMNNSAASFSGNSSQISIVKYIFMPSPPLPSLHQPGSCLGHCFLVAVFSFLLWYSSVVSRCRKCCFANLTSTRVSEYQLLLGGSP